MFLLIAIVELVAVQQHESSRKKEAKGKTISVAHLFTDCKNTQALSKTCHYNPLYQGREG
jgi:hypothetical protein